MLAGKFEAVSTLGMAAAGSIELASRYSVVYFIAQARCSKISITKALAKRQNLGLIITYLSFEIASINACA
jgi:hypothetical protein